MVNYAKKLLIFINTLLPVVTTACTCVPFPTYRVDTTELKEYDFIAHVLITNANSDTNNISDKIATIQILELFKGSNVSSIREEGKNSFCKVGFLDGEEWVVFCKIYNGELYQSICDRYVQIRESDGTKKYGADHLSVLREYYHHPEKKIDDGVNREYYRNCQIEIEENYLNGKYHGERKMWYPNGQIMRIDTFVNGHLSGLSRSWYPNGGLKCTGLYVDGASEGKSVCYYPSGQISSIHFAANGKLVGQYVTYFDTSESLDFMLKSSGLPNGDIDSLIRLYNKIQVQDEWIYNDKGEIMIKRAFRRNGHIEHEEIFVNELNWVTYISYHENGRLESVGYKKDGKKYGHYQWYDENGLPTRGWDYDEDGRIIKKN
ncbi:MAG: hypothetical protein GC181_09275 [Bacteroidetes bacterium]|nr:hypothetical protein [Bacteroidota bacterium]